MSPRKSAPEEDRRPLRAFASMVAAAVVAVVVVGWQTMERGGPRDSLGSPTASGSAQPQSRPSGRAIPAGVLPVWDSLFATETPARPKIVMPIGGENFDTFSAPEQEAVIDFMNEHRIPETNVRY